MSDTTVRAEPSESAPKVRLGFDVTPLFGPRTGVGAVTASILQRLQQQPEIRVVPVLVSWRAKKLISASLDEGAVKNFREVKPVRFPARIAHQLWRRFDWPNVSGMDVMHGVNFVVPPARDAVELVTIHDLTAWHMPELVDQHSLNYPTLVSRAINRGAHVHAVSAAVAAEVEATFGIDPKKIHTIRNGFDLTGPHDSSEPPTNEQIDRLADKGRTIAGGPYVLCLGTIEPRKDHPGLIAAMTKVWRKHSDIRLVLAGGDGWGTAALDQAIRNHNLADDPRIVRLGYVSDQDRRSLLAGAKCLAYPSVYEGFGLPPLEAMSLSTPVVATMVPAVAEVCGDAALLVPVRDADRLAAGMIDVLDDGRPDLVRKGCDRAAQFSWDSSVAELVDLYRSLAGERPRG